MKPKLDREELDPLIEEAIALEEADQERVEREAVTEALAEVGVSPGRLAQAEQSLREKAAKRQARHRKIAIGASAAVLAASLVTYVAISHVSTASALAKMTAGEASVSGLGGPRPFPTLEANLHDAPMGERIDLSCEWKSPSGQVVHENRWQTKPVNKAVWPTHCKFDGPPKGHYTVTLKQGGRELLTKEFDNP